MIRSLLAAAVAALPAFAWAAEPSSSGGMPQLDFGSPLIIAQVVWLLIIFGLLYAVMSSVALPRVASVLAERRLRIEGDLNAAQGAKAAADEAMAAHRAATAKVRAEAQAALTAATQAAQAEGAAKAAATNARLDAEVAGAEARIAASREQALQALPQVATDTAEALVARLSGGADRAVVERAVNTVLAQQRAA